MLKFVCLLLFSTCTFEYSVSLALPENIQGLLAVSNGLNEFADNFYKKGKENEGEKNLICSPISASLVLSMTAYGARGNTENQMKNVLKMPQEKNLANIGYKHLMETLNNIKSVDLKLANNIFLSEGIELKPEFKDVVSTSFKSDLKNVNFENAETAKDTINSWVEEHTGNTIKNMLKKGDIEGAKMVLINAVYFKGNWMKKFKGMDSYDGEFHTDKDTVKKVAMMHQTSFFNHSDCPELDAKILQLPYEHENEEDATSMFIILPNKVDGLKMIEENLDKLNYQALSRNPNNSMMSLHMPKFKIERSLDLKPVLKDMGMTDMFEDSADFQGITDSTSLKISKVMQKAFIEVDEMGSKAAAATGIVMVEMSLLIPEMTMKVDRPFHFAIVHTLTNTILFQGHVIDPTKTSE